MRKALIKKTLDTPPSPNGPPMVRVTDADLPEALAKMGKGEGQRFKVAGYEKLIPRVALIRLERERFAAYRKSASAAEENYLQLHSLGSDAVAGVALHKFRSRRTP